MEKILNHLKQLSKENVFTLKGITHPKKLVILNKGYSVYTNSGIMFIFKNALFTEPITWSEEGETLTNGRIFKLIKKINEEAYIVGHLNVKEVLTKLKKEKETFKGDQYPKPVAYLSINGTSVTFEPTGDTIYSFQFNYLKRTLEILSLLKVDLAEVYFTNSGKLYIKSGQMNALMAPVITRGYSNEKEQ